MKLIKRILGFPWRLILPLILKTGPIVTDWLATKTVQNLPQPNLSGDRDVEWSWVLSELKSGPGEALDFGCGYGMLSFIAARKGYKVTALDLLPVTWRFRLPNLNFIQGDILKVPFARSSFDVIINCSTIEHVGLTGRYGSDDEPDGDIKAMALMHELIRPGGAMILTVPIGQDAVFRPLHRVYGKERLPRLLNGWTIEKEQYWIKDKDNLWEIADKSAALEKEPTRYYYGLGCFVLR